MGLWGRWWRSEGCVRRDHGRPGPAEGHGMCHVAGGWEERGAGGVEGTCASVTIPVRNLEGPVLLCAEWAKEVGLHRAQG